MDATTNKMQAGAAGGGIGALIGSALCAWIFAQWPFLVGPPWESVISGFVTVAISAALAGYGAWVARNKITTPQITTAIEKGDVTSGQVRTVATHAAEAARS